ncbi:MAG: tRNA lysidine(34) synthetase TilS [Planctomycetota bacterium]|nr:tRNA lysidine(34) synthetase TilS [Planctomycetota bacterium]MDA1222997.1 tRNA lysidine(34) synthetase TilS [Planctomycetota bacterium]
MHGRVVIAASGGCDSTALAWAMTHLLRPALGGAELHLVHCDHGQHALRVEAARAVTALGARLGCPVHVIDLGLSEGASEQLMRDARYAALGVAAVDICAPVVMTAHHADDQIETVVMRGARGTGSRGLAGIPRERPLRDGVRLCRPLLDVRRDDLRELVRSQDLPFVEDPTNAELDRTRNRTRHILLPELRARRPDFDAAVLRVAGRAAHRTNRAQIDAQAWLASHLEDAHPTRIHLTAFPPADRCGREVLRAVHLAMTGEAPLGSWLDRVTTMALQRTGARVDAAVGHRLRVERTRFGLHFSDPTIEAPDAPVPISENGMETRFGATAWSIVLGAGDTATPTERFDPAAAPGPYTLRGARPGDRIDARSLRRVFAAAGTPVADRSTLPLLCAADGGIVWAPGLGVAPSARVRPGTERSLTVERRLHRVGIDLELAAY